MFSLGPRGHVRVALAVLIVTVGSLAAVLAQDLQSTTINEVFRLNARHLEDGRVEVSAERWTGSEWHRHSPSSRFLPADHTVGQWFNSEMFAVAVPTAGQAADLQPIGEKPHLSVSSLDPLHPTSLMESMSGDDWTLWRLPRTGRDTLHAFCYHGTGAVHVLSGGDRWLPSNAVHLMTLVVDVLHEDISGDFADQITSKCDVDASAALADGLQVVRHVSPEPSASPPDADLFEVSALAVTGNWAGATEEGSGWAIWHMHRADGPDAYAACRTDTGALHSKAHGDAWEPTTVEGLRDHFSFASWYFVDHIMQDIGRACEVNAPAQGHPDARAQVSADPEPQPEPRAEVPNIAGSVTMSNSRDGQLHGAERIAIQWHSSRPSSWSASIIVSTGRGRLLLAPGIVPVSVGGRTFNFVVPDHDGDWRHGSLIDGIWGVGTEATLIGSAARDFYCASKGNSLGFNVNTNSGDERVASVYIREIQTRDGIELCK